MNLIEIYIHEVTRRLPGKSREDIWHELRSTIEDTLPDDYTEEDVQKALEKLGNPATFHPVGIYEGNGGRLEFVTPSLNQKFLTYMNDILSMTTEQMTFENLEIYSNNIPFRI